MSRTNFYQRIDQELVDIRQEGLWKTERPITSPQGGTVSVAHAGPVLNLCANNYLGLASHPDIEQAAVEAIAKYGFGMASVRFICGTLDLHREVEHDLANYLGTEDTILFGSCFDANGALFEALLGPDDAIISDSLNHASIIDGIRLSKARRYRFNTRDLNHLEEQLQNAKTEGTGQTLIVTDGVFSMDGYLADLAGICQLADQYQALVMVDDCHATGLLGPDGRGTPALAGVVDRIDIVSSTLGKALGGGMGGFIAARKNVTDLLRQRARPYLFSNALAPALLGGAQAALTLVRNGDPLRQQLHANAQQFRTAMTKAGFTLSGQGHPIIPVMIGEAAQAAALANHLFEQGVYVTAFSYPVVPHGTARIRTQMNSAHSSADIDQVVSAFVDAAQHLKILAPPA
ncbi:MAG TPA: glycine C-acetyltransferase [Acidimicrobiia bacterium]|jgi:glycine C-acetyltransferase|nr:glycine C-acetyltransferase [Acidimicrobiia bacterium]HIL47044.1 glycine C-acetyltransferase [Acidimicrobiia bacterium]